jgi:hypothetical protein
MLVAGISNAVWVSAPVSVCDEEGNCDYPRQHSMAMTVDQGTNHYWGWGDLTFGAVGNGTNMFGANQSTPAQAQFCTRCQRCVQLGSSGSFTAECNGTLYLYFNDDQTAFGDNGTNAYRVIFKGVTNNVPGNAGNGVIFGTVTNGGNYAYSASGFCVYDSNGDSADPDGKDPSHQQVDCSLINLNITNAICPARACFSLVGKIQ